MAHVSRAAAPRRPGAAQVSGGAMRGLDWTDNEVTSEDAVARLPMAAMCAADGAELVEEVDQADAEQHVGG